MNSRTAAPARGSASRRPTAVGGGVRGQIGPAAGCHLAGQMQTKAPRFTSGRRGTRARAAAGTFLACWQQRGARGSRSGRQVQGAAVDAACTARDQLPMPFCQPLCLFVGGCTTLCASVKIRPSGCWLLMGAEAAAAERSATIGRSRTRTAAVDLLLCHLRLHALSSPASYPVQQDELVVSSWGASCSKVTGAAVSARRPRRPAARAAASSAAHKRAQAATHKVLPALRFSSPAKALLLLQRESRRLPQAHRRRRCPDLSSSPPPAAHPAVSQQPCTPRCRRCSCWCASLPPPSPPRSRSCLGLPATRPLKARRRTQR